MKALGLFGTRTAWSQWVNNATKFIGGYPDPLQHLRPLLSEDWCLPLLGELRRKFISSQRFHPLWWTTKCLLKGDKRQSYSRGLVILLTSRSFMEAAKLSNGTIVDHSSTFWKRASNKLVNASSTSNSSVLPQHWRLAEMCETVYMGMALHRTVVDTRKLYDYVNNLDDDNNHARIRLSATGSLAATETDGESLEDGSKGGSSVDISRQNLWSLLQELELGNKLATLSGGMLLSTVSSGLADLENVRVVEMVCRGMSDSIQSQFTRYATLCEPTLCQPPSLLAHLTDVSTSSTAWPPLPALHHSAHLLTRQDWEEYVRLAWTSPQLTCAQSALLFTVPVGSDEERAWTQLVEEFLVPWSCLYRFCEELNSLAFTLRTEESSAAAATSNGSRLGKRSSEKTSRTPDKSDSTPQTGPVASVEDLWLSQPPRGPCLAHILFCSANGSSQGTAPDPSTSPRTPPLCDFLTELLSPSSSATFHQCLQVLSEYADKSRAALDRFPQNESTTMLRKMVDLLESNCQKVQTA